MVRVTAARSRAARVTTSTICAVRNVVRKKTLTPVVEPPTVDEDEAQIARIRALSTADRLELGVALSRTAAELRRAAWEARRDHD